MRGTICCCCCCFYLSLLLQQREFQTHQLESVEIILNENHELLRGTKNKKRNLIMMMIITILCFIDSERIR